MDRSITRRMLVRHALRDDAAQIALIWQTGWHDGHDGNVPDDLSRHRRAAADFVPRVFNCLPRTRVAEDESGDLVHGFVVIDGDRIEQLYVLAAVRGIGIGRALLRHAEQSIARGGHPHARLAIVPGNTRARAIVEQAGWRDDGPVDYAADTTDGVVVIPSRQYVKNLPLA